MGAGYYDEARAWRDWLVRAVAGSPNQLQIMYAVTGERRLTEWEVPWLSGYENSKPVRIGNAAHTQLQLDVYGELMDALYQAPPGRPPREQAGMGDPMCPPRSSQGNLEEPDEGIWEVRGGAKHFTYSKIMAWVAFDRAIKSADEFGMHGPVEDGRRSAPPFRKTFVEHGYDEQRQTLRSGVRRAPARCEPAADPRRRFPAARRSAGDLDHQAIERELLKDGLCVVSAVTKVVYLRRLERTIRRGVFTGCFVPN